MKVILLHKGSKEYSYIFLNSLSCGHSDYQAPENLDLPFLPYRTQKDKRTVFALCRSCAESNSTTQCFHEPVMRTLHGEYTFQDVNMALRFINCNFDSDFFCFPTDIVGLQMLEFKNENMLQLIYLF